MREREEVEEEARERPSSSQSKMSIVEEWKHIEEEVKIRDEVRRRLSHTLGPDEEEEDTWIPKDFPCKVLTTKWGSVYHSSLQCKYLRSVQTGMAKESKWCATCRNLAGRSRLKSFKGVVLHIHGWGNVFHSDTECPEIGLAPSFPACAACKTYG